MNWLFSAGTVSNNKRKTSSGAAVRQPLVLQVVSHHVEGRWRVFSDATGLTGAQRANKMWQEVLSELVEK